MARKIPAAAQSPIPWQFGLGVKAPGWVFPKLALLKTEFLTTCSQIVAVSSDGGVFEHLKGQIGDAGALILIKPSQGTTVEPL